jgi:hypothetical protein
VNTTQLRHVLLNAARSYDTNESDPQRIVSETQFRTGVTDPEMANLCRDLIRQIDDFHADQGNLMCLDMWSERADPYEH